MEDKSIVELVNNIGKCAKEIERLSKEDSNLNYFNDLTEKYAKELQNV
jgi:hypothetical protein